MNNKIEEINKDLDDVILLNEIDISLYSGLGGVLLFKYMYYKHYLNNNNEELTLNLEPIIYSVFDQINSTEYSFSFCDGLAGIGFCLNYIKNDNIFEEEIEAALIEFDSILISKIGEISKPDDIDILHGHLGIVYYLIDRGNDSIEDPVFIKNMNNILTYIKNEVDSTLTGKDVLVNFGLAHGYLSYVKIIIKLLKLPAFANPENNTLLNNLIEIYLSYKSEDENSFSLFPSIVKSKEKPEQNNINLGWCYGDQPASLILYEASQFLNNDNLKKEAIDIAYTWAKRNSTEKAFNNGIYDACFCHGTTSAGYLNKKWYKITGDQVFLDNYNYFMNETIKIGNHKEGAAGYLKLEEEGLSKDSTLLGGAAGIGIVLIDHLCGKETDWDKFFLLDI